MHSIKFLGAVGTVTGSRFILEIDGHIIMVDCGMYQGLKENRLKNWDTFPVPPEKIERILLTHAHTDHTGYLPKLYREGFKGKIHCTHSTRDLCNILLLDSAHIQEEDARWANKKGYTKYAPALPLYTVKDAENTIDLFEPVNYGQALNLWDGVRVKFRDAGHILGSSFVDIKITNGEGSCKILFSGDLGRPDRPILQDPVQVFNVDYLILESTYGDRLHESESSEEDFARIINESMKRGGVLVMPSFAVGRTQTLLYMIRELEEAGKIPVIPVYVDSPMALDATEVFEKRLADQDITSRLETVRGKRIFRTGNLHFCDTQAQSIALNSIKGNAIIISSSGMASAGRVQHHLALRLPHPQNTVLFTGFQAEGTRGRMLLEGAESIRIHGDEIPVKAKVDVISGFSGHADYNEIMAWLMGFNRKPKKVFIVHGEPSSASALADKIEKKFRWDVVIPGFGDKIELE